MKIGFPGLLTIVFITLKLTGYIAWSWWWVLSPIWIVALLTVGIITLAAWADSKKTDAQRSWERDISKYK